MKTLLPLLITIMFSVSAFAGFSSADTIIYGSNPKVGKYIKIRGFNMYYEVYGRGELYC